MQTFHIPSEFNDGHDKRGQTGRVCHTFPQIARILAERDGETISPTCVKQICRTAEAKFVSALLADSATCARPCFDRSADQTLRLRGGDGFADYMRSN